MVLNEFGRGKGKYIFFLILKFETLRFARWIREHDEDFFIEMVQFAESKFVLKKKSQIHP